MRISDWSSDVCSSDLRQRLHRHLPAGGEDAQRDRQVEAAAVLGQVGGGEVDGDRALRELELRATDRGAHAVARLAHRRLRQADHVHPRQAAGEVDLAPDLGGVDSCARTSVHERKRHGARPSAAAVRPAWPPAAPRAVPPAAPARPASRALSAAQRPPRRPPPPPPGPPPPTPPPPPPP